MCPSLIQIRSKTAEKNSAQTNKQTDKQTDNQTNRHYENNGHIAVNQQQPQRRRTVGGLREQASHDIQPSPVVCSCSVHDNHNCAELRHSIIGLMRFIIYAESQHKQIF